MKTKERAIKVLNTFMRMENTHFSTQLLDMIVTLVISNLKLTVDNEKAPTTEAAEARRFNDKLDKIQNGNL